MEPFPLFLFLEGPKLVSVPPLANAHITKNPEKQYTKMAILIADSFILLPKIVVMLVPITTML